MGFRGEKQINSKGLYSLYHAVGFLWTEDFNSEMFYLVLFLRKYKVTLTCLTLCVSAHYGGCVGVHETRFTIGVWYVSLYASHDYKFVRQSVSHDPVAVLARSHQSRLTARVTWHSRRRYPSTSHFSVSISLMRVKRLGGLSSFIYSALNFKCIPITHLFQISFLYWLKTHSTIDTIPRYQVFISVKHQTAQETDDTNEDDAMSTGG